jgi:hypothetical protein
MPKPFVTNTKGKRRSRFLSTTVSCILVSSVRFASAQSWTQTSASTGAYWYSVASSLDGARLVAASYLDVPVHGELPFTL